MTREDNPTYFAHVCEVIKSVFMAEEVANEKHKIGTRLANHKITPDEYVEAIADELLSKTNKEDIERAEK